jgi:hypothetical protein
VTWFSTCETSGALRRLHHANAIHSPGLLLGVSGERPHGNAQPHNDLAPPCQKPQVLPGVGQSSAMRVSVAPFRRRFR